MTAISRPTTPRSSTDRLRYVKFRIEEPYPDDFLDVVKWVCYVWTAQFGEEPKNVHMEMQYQLDYNIRYIIVWEN